MAEDSSPKYSLPATQADLEVDPVTWQRANTNYTQSEGYANSTIAFPSGAQQQKMHAECEKSQKKRILGLTVPVFWIVVVVFVVILAGGIGGGVAGGLLAQKSNSSSSNGNTSSSNSSSTSR
jgi:hypothetical protein